MTSANLAATNGQNGKIDFGQSLAVVRELIETTLLRADPAIADVMDHLRLEQGKNFRARLLLATATGPDGLVSHEAVTAAAALEILHLATLVHDDIIDDAPTRRGRPSVQGQFGKKTAVITGDYLFCVCMTMVAGLANQFPNRYAAFTQAMLRVCLGEMKQYRHNWDTGLSVINYLKIIASKTAALFALATYAGGILGGAGEPEARRLARFGLAVGMQYQLADDCLDYEATAAAFKKSVKHDLGEGVITLPLILALAKFPGLKQKVREQALSSADIEFIVAEVVRLGGVAAAWALAARYHGRAGSQLEQVADPARQARLGAILESIMNRSH